MRTETETLVLGGGLIGAWTAFFLARRGRRVTLIEKDSTGAQSSGVNFGNLRLQGRHPAQYPLSLRSQDLWERIGELIGDTCEFERTGHLYCAFDAEEAAKLQAYADVSRSVGLRIERLGRAELRGRFPWIGDHVEEATFSARDAVANPRLVTPAVARAARALGAEIVEHCRIVGIEHSPRGFALRAQDGRMFHGVHLVNCAGAWAAEFARGFGEDVPAFAAGPPQFVTEPCPFLVEPSIQTIDGSVIARQTRRGNVILAGYPRSAADPVANRAPVPPHKTLAAMRALGRMVPALRSCHVIRVWSGIEAYLPDMMPIIGPSATVPGLFHAFGFCGHGFQIGPGVGLCLSELICDAATPTPLDAFGIGRFRAGVAVSDKFRKEFDSQGEAR